MAFGNGFGGGNNNRFPRNNNPRTGNTTKEESTNGPILYNSQSGKFLQFDYWGRYATIRIGTIQPGMPLTYENRRNAKTTSQIMSFGDLSDLQDVCDEVMESLRNAGTFTSTAVRVGTSGNCLVEINNGSNIGQSNGIYLVIYKDLDQAGRTASMDVYPFTSTKVLRSYDPQSGGSKEDVTKLGQFKKFYKLVAESTKAFTMATAHAVTVADKPNRLTAFKALAAISQSMGVSISKELELAIQAPSPAGGNGGGGNRWGGGGNRSNFGGGSYGGGRSSYGGGGNRSFNGNGGGAPSGPAPSVNDPIDINLSLNDMTNVNLDQFK